VQPVQRQDAAAQLEHLARAVHGDDVLARRAQRHLHRGAGQDEAVRAHAHHQAVDDRHGERQLDLEGGPRPTSEEISILPRSFSMLRFTTSMPTPRPETAVTFSAVEKPGAKMKLRISSRA
jgi:hypothetical protein